MSKSLTEILEAEQELSIKKIDHLVKKSFFKPSVDENGTTYLGFGSSRDKYLLTDTGITSYLDKIGVPLGFYRLCSPELKLEILSEFQRNVPNANDIWRVRTLNHEIRYIGSNRYTPYDNIDILTAIKESNIDSKGLVVKEYFDDGNLFVLRICQKEPLNTTGRPFFAGVQFANSEVGQCSVKTACMIWEEVCTNGLTIPIRELGSSRLIHAGTDQRESMEQNIDKLLSTFDDFTHQSIINLESAERTSGAHYLIDLKGHANISEGLYETIVHKAESYAQDKDNMTALDVISGYTDAMQSASREERFRHESHAGKMLWRIS